MDRIAQTVTGFRTSFSDEAVRAAVKTYWKTIWRFKQVSAMKLELRRQTARRRRRRKTLQTQLTTSWPRYVC
jgi:hypothetical protein